ncbi:NADH-quinone oxidoreductase subunit A [Buchnera aphidicola]|uniref:NADH-quinone oxidoreductase subunit n=1 Tax=Buchnera aphidicola subsp. Cinara cedri (strain Cc) TaxID=372461 RepID=Q057X5_BUCCC|nr:NADH-quinone oxidoreductase subunit A [Buchnera aphidicola]ABJ90574.1 NADH dehydrogenase I chain A [Buchnera aphidicola BCc]
MNVNYEFFGFYFFIFCSFFLCFFMLFLGYFFGSKSYFRDVPEPFESGIISFGNTKLPVPIKFSLIAILFVIFDVEILYLYSWSVCINKLEWIIFFEMYIFIAFLFLTWFYLIKKKIFKKNLFK